MTGTLPVPTVGQPNTTEDVDVRDALNTLNGLLTGSNLLDGAQLGGGTVAAAALGSNAVTTAKILDANVTTPKIADANVTDVKIASPNNSVYKTIFTTASVITADLATGSNYMVGRKTVASAGAVVNQNQMTSGNTFTNDGSSNSPIIANQFPLLYIAAADYSVGSLTSKLRLRAQVSTNGTAWSSVTITFGLHPVTTAGGTDLVTPTLGGATSGSTVPIVNPVANATTQGNSGDFNFPTDGLFAIGFTMSATLTNNAAAFITAQLQTRNT